LNHSNSLLESSTTSHLPNTAAAGGSGTTTEERYYSGFPTLKQESIYDKLIEKALQLLCQRVLMLMETQVVQQEGSIVAFHSWGKQVLKVCKYLGLMEKNKVSMPKYAGVIEPLGTFLRE